MVPNRSDKRCVQVWRELRDLLADALIGEHLGPRYFKDRADGP